MNVPGFYPAKVTYIVDREKFDAVIDLGFMITKRVRCRLRGMPPIKHEYYREVKKLLSQWLHRHDVYIRTFKGEYVGVWDAEVYLLHSKSPIKEFDITIHKLDELELLNDKIIEELKHVLGREIEIIDDQNYLQET